MMTIGHHTPADCVEAATNHNTLRECVEEYGCAVE